MTDTRGTSFFFQAEDGIRDSGVTGVQTCALPICCGERRRWFPLRSAAAGGADRFSAQAAWRQALRLGRPVRAGTRRDRKSVVLGKSVDLGGRRIIKKKKRRRLAPRSRRRYRAEHA